MCFIVNEYLLILHILWLWWQMFILSKLPVTFEYSLTFTGKQWCVVFPLITLIVYFFLSVSFPITFSLFFPPASFSLSLSWKWGDRQHWRETDIALTQGNILTLCPFTVRVHVCKQGAWVCTQIDVLVFVCLLMKNPVSCFKARAACETTELFGSF